MSMKFKQGIETYGLQVRLNPATSAGFLAIFSHANTADRTYTFPDLAGGTVILSNSTLVGDTAGTPAATTIASTVVTGKVLTGFSASPNSAIVATDTILAAFGKTQAQLNAALISPMTTLGDIIYENASPAAARLAGNTTTTNKFLTQVGNGSISAAPTWATIVSGDLTTALTTPPAIGGTTPAAGSFTTLSATGLVTITTGRINQSYTDTTTSGTVVNAYFNPTMNPASASTSTLYGSRSEVNSGGTQNLGTLIGALGHINVNTTGTITATIGLQAIVATTAATNTPITIATGLSTVINNAGTGTITTAYGARVLSATNGGTITTLYGLKIEDQTVGGTSFSLHTGQGNGSLGDDFTFRQVSTPTAPTIGTPTAGGSIDAGVHLWKVTYLTNTSFNRGETLLSAASSSFNIIGGTQTMPLTIPVSADGRVVARRIYRTKAGGSIYYQVGQVNDNTTTTFSDTFADSTLALTSPSLSTSVGFTGTLRSTAIYATNGRSVLEAESDLQLVLRRTNTATGAVGLTAIGDRDSAVTYCGIRFNSMDATDIVAGSKYIQIQFLDAGTTGSLNISTSGVGGNTNFTDSTASTTTTSGAVVVTGGLGIGGAINAGSDIVSVLASGTSRLAADSAAGSIKLLVFRSAGLSRWDIRSDSDAESGSNAGSTLKITAYTDAGASIDNPVTITRAAGGTITVARPLTISGTNAFSTGGTIASTNTTSATSSTTGALTLVGGLGINTSATATSGSLGGLFILQTNTPGSLATVTGYGALIQYTHAGGFGNNTNDITAIRGLMTTSHSAGTVLTAIGVKAAVQNTGAGTLTSGAGVYVPSAINSGGGTFTNNYGIFIEAQSAGGTNYALYTAGAGLVKIQDTTASVSTVTGALTIIGGVGIGGAINVGAISTFAATDTTTSSSTISLVSSTLTIAPASSSSATFISTNSVITNSTNNSFIDMVGVRGISTITGSGTGAGLATGLRGVATHNGTSAAALLVGVNSQVSVTAAGTVTTARGFFFGGFTISGGGAITTAVGLDIAVVSGAGTNYSIRTAGGIVSIGDTTTASSAIVASTTIAGGLGINDNLIATNGITANASNTVANLTNVPVWIKVGTVTPATFSTAATTNSVTLFSLVAGGIIHAVKIKHSTAFSGTGVTSYTISVGVSGNNTKYASAFNIFQATGNTTFQISSGMGSENHGAATNITATATCNVNLNFGSSAGSADIWVLLSKAT